jgi:protein phosphatase
MYIKSDLNCNIGSVRPNNEDIILFGGELFRDQTQILDFAIAEKPPFAVAVADGMGGHNGGEIASEYAAQFFFDFVSELPDGLSAEEITEKIKGWTQIAHRGLLSQSMQNPELDGMGTTFCGMLFYEKLVLAINIGDSRLYRFRNSILRQISTDHSMQQLTRDQSLPSNQIYNSLGAGDSAFVEVKDLTGLLYDDDIFLICSDGLSDLITDEEIEQILSAEPTAEKLVEAAKNAGGKDNVSVVLLKIKESEKIQKHE